ncbi:MAG: response regulator [Candidatus Sericytochromatia bacterium]
MKEQKTSVLVVDDDSSITTIIEGYLYTKDIDIVAVNSAFDAIELLKTKEFDLILTDVNMPNINGFELLLWLKNNNIKSHVVIMTAQANDKAKEVYHSYGILKYLSKPLELKSLLELINHIDNDGFSSNIKNITLFDYIQVMTLSKKTNALSIESPLLKNKAYLYFKDGELIEAEYNDEKGEEAFFKIIKIDGGIINEIDKELLTEGSIKTPSISLLFKATQKIDEENAKKENINEKIYNILLMNINNTLSDSLDSLINNLSNKPNIYTKPVNTGQEMSLDMQSKYFALIICDINMFKNNGPEFLIWLKKNNINSKVGVLINDDIDISNNQLISDSVIYIKKPIDFGSFNKIIESEMSSGFSGKINKITLFDYIQMISLSRKTKTISINSPLAYSEGIVYFNNGNVVHAIYEDSVGVEALFKLMTTSGGVITELEENFSGEQTIKLSLPSLLMKATAYIEQENFKRTNINIDQKIINSINSKLKTLSEPVKSTTLPIAKAEININLPNTIAPKSEPMINRSSLIQQKPQVQDISNKIQQPLNNVEKPNLPPQFSLLNLKRKVTAKLNMPEEDNSYLKPFESLRVLVPELSDKGEKVMKNPSTDMATYQMLRKIEGTINLDIIYQTYYHHLNLFDFFAKYEPIINLVNYKPFDKENTKTNIFQILLFTKAITTDILREKINSYLNTPQKSTNDRYFVDGSFLVEAGCITAPELTKVSLFVNKFNKFIDNI